MVYKSGTTKDVWYNYFDGNSWLAQDIKVTTDGHIQTSKDPAVAVFLGVLFVAYKDGN
jgi:hypothetical protein